MTDLNRRELLALAAAPLLLPVAAGLAAEPAPVASPPSRLVFWRYFDIEEGREVLVPYGKWHASLELSADGTVHHLGLGVRTGPGHPFPNGPRAQQERLVKDLAEYGPYGDYSGSVSSPLSTPEEQWTLHFHTMCNRRPSRVYWVHSHRERGVEERWLDPLLQPHPEQA